MQHPLTKLSFTSFLMILYVIFFNASVAFADENIEYRFERLWPKLEQPWYFNQPQGIAVAPDSSVYIADSWNNHIQQFTAEGLFIRMWGSKGSAEGQFNDPRGITVAADGSIYVADTKNRRIQQFTTEGVFIRMWGSKGLTEEGQFNDPKGITVAADGSVYIADADNHRIQQFTAEGVFIRMWGSAGEDEGQFNEPSDITVATDGSVYVADTKNHRIQQFTAEGVFIRMWGSAGADEGAFSFPQGITIATDGRVYVADSDNNRIQQFTAEGVFIRMWASSGLAKEQFNFPQAMSITADGSVYVADADNHRIQQFTAEGLFIRMWGSEGVAEGAFNYPSGITVATDGSVYVSDAGNNRIQQFTAEGMFIRMWGSAGVAEGAFSVPKGITVAADGSVYVADTWNHRIQQFTAEGMFIRMWGSEGFDERQLKFPQDISIAPDGTVYVVDSRIQQFTSEGVFIRSLGSKGSAEGQFILVNNITVAANGSVYIADFYNNRIQQFTAEGVFIRSWGSQGSAKGQFNDPKGITVAADGSVYVADTGNHRIQKFVPHYKTAAKHSYKAIVLAGGGKTIGGRINHIWEGTWRLAQKASKALSQQAFIVHDEIKFLTAGNTQMDLDNNGKLDDLEFATKESLKTAITEWATDANDVVIFLANHGGPGKFQINDSEILTGAELNTWVDQLDAAIPGKVTVVIEACNSAGFFESLSKPGRYLLASAKADQPALISNNGLNAFSYYFWSEVASGAYLQDAFKDARQGMSKTTLNNNPQNAQADTDGDKAYSRSDLDTLGDYCLGNCNKTAAAPPVISPIAMNELHLNGDTNASFNIHVNHLQSLSSVWALVQRPDDINIDSNEPLNFATIKLTCDDADYCEGNYQHFDTAGNYQLNFYAMDSQSEVSFPETVTVTQAQGKAVSAAIYDDSIKKLYLRDIEVNGERLQVVLELQSDQFVVTEYSKAPQQYQPSAKFDPSSGRVTIPYVDVAGTIYQATLKHVDNLNFVLESAEPRSR